MRLGIRIGCVCAAMCALVLAGAAQEARPADPRTGLRAGLRDAGQAVRNMVLIASLPKPEGFFDPKEPAGMTVAPERGPDSIDDNPGVRRPGPRAANLNF